jgi:4-hydroxythreonine-4-phosphate dehydrogenase
MSKIKLGISIGDVNGIGPEVIIKALSNELILKQCTPIIYGSAKSIGYHKNVVADPNFSFVSIQSAEKAVFNKVNVLNCGQEGVHISLGKASKEGGQFAYIALDHAVQDLKQGNIHALVTAPVNKHAMRMAEFPYLGHTEYLADQLSSEKGVTMMMVSEHLRVALATTHVPLGGVADLIDKALVLSKINSVNKSLKIDFGIEKPTIAVLGLNPHAGDDSEIGDEEEQYIRPAILEAKKNGIMVSGPYPADGFFGNHSHTKFDAVLAMYHDQGLVPFKTLSFGSGVNFTAGLDQVRTSPDHGTAYNIAGQNLADGGSMRQAIYLAIDIYRRRKEYQEVTQNTLVGSNKEEEVGA